MPPACGGLLRREQGGVSHTALIFYFRFLRYLTADALTLPFEVKADMHLIRSALRAATNYHNGQRKRRLHRARVILPILLGLVLIGLFLWNDRQNRKRKP
jgi:hypothetical protein